MRELGKTLNVMEERWVLGIILRQAVLAAIHESYP
jgi:hypothetical protein